MTYLVLRIQSIGNVAMTVPILASLSNNYPDDTFVVVARKRLNGLFYGFKNVKFHETDLSNGGLKNIIQLYHELKRYHIDAVVDLQDVTRTRILRSIFAWHHCPVYVIDYGRSEKKAMTLTGYRNEKIPTEFDRYASTFQKAGLVSDNSFTKIKINQAAQQNIQERYGIKSGTWIGIAPFAKSKSNMLPYRTMKTTIQQLCKRPDIRVYLFGAGDVECEMLRQWASIFSNVVSVAGQLPLEEEIELMRQLDLMVCMDSANQHLSSLVGLRTISIWCATHPAMGFYGWKQNPNDEIQLPLSCRPCTIHGTQHCRFRNFACQNIESEKIIEKILHTI